MKINLSFMFANKLLSFTVALSFAAHGLSLFRSPGRNHSSGQSTRALSHVLSAFHELEPRGKNDGPGEKPLLSKNQSTATVSYTPPPLPVLHVAGNHEYYNFDRGELAAWMIPDKENPSLSLPPHPLLTAGNSKSSDNRGRTSSSLSSHAAASSSDRPLPIPLYYGWRACLGVVVLVLDGYEFSMIGSEPMKQTSASSSAAATAAASNGKKKEKTSGIGDDNFDENSYGGTSDSDQVSSVGAGSEDGGRAASTNSSNGPKGNALNGSGCPIGDYSHEAAVDYLQSKNPNDVLHSSDWLKGIHGTQRRFVPYNGVCLRMMLSLLFSLNSFPSLVTKASLLVSLQVSFFFPSVSFILSSNVF